MAKKNYEYTDNELADIAIAHPEFKSPNFSLYTNDFLGSNKIIMLTDVAYRGYVNLLLAEWNEKDCGLPTTDPTTVGKLVKLSKIERKSFEENMEDILQFFFEYQGRLFNRRLLEERLKQIKRREINTNNINQRYSKSTNNLPEGLPENLQSKVPPYDLSDKDNDTDKDNKEVKDNSKKADILNYFSAKGYPLSEAEEFFNHYESQGWVTGNGIPIVNWRVKAENWHKEQMRRISDKPKPEYKQKIDNSTYRQAFVKKLDDCENGCGKKGTMRFGERKILVCSKRCGEEFEEKNKNAFNEIEKLVAGMKA